MTQNEKVNKVTHRKALNRCQERYMQISAQAMRALEVALETNLGLG